MKRILVATDGSEGGDRAIDVAAELAKVAGAALVLLTIGGSVTGAELRRLADDGGDLSRTLEARADHVLKRAAKRAKRVGVEPVAARCEWGDPAEAIIDIARREKVDAVVVGRRGGGRLSRLLMGSVSQKVASLAPCTVVVVP
jgi:nucleotide-binding universal stress UspA family protein